MVAQNAGIDVAHDHGVN